MRDYGADFPVSVAGAGAVSEAASRAAVLGRSDAVAMHAETTSVCAVWTGLAAMDCCFKKLAGAGGRRDCDGGQLRGDPDYRSGGVGAVCALGGEFRHCARSDSYAGSSTAQRDGTAGKLAYFCSVRDGKCLGAGLFLDAAGELGLAGTPHRKPENDGKQGKSKHGLSSGAFARIR